MVKLSTLIRVWDILHQGNVGELGFCDLVNAVEQVSGVKNDISPCQPRK